MVGVVIDYSDHRSSIHFIKILSGDKIVEIYPKIYPDVRINMQIEFNPDNNVFTVLK